MVGVNAPILKTKLYKPRIGPDFLQRPPLIERLQNGRFGKLTLLTAPAGFGKSSLVTQWLEQDTAVAWLSLDEADNVLVRFWRYFIGAVQTVVPQVGVGIDAQLQDLLSPNIKPLIEQLINEIADADTEFVLVLDDFHNLILRPIHQSLAYFLVHQPPNLHLVITSRAQLPFSIAKMRVKQLAQTLDITDLRLSFGESKQVLNGQAGLNLAEADLNLLHKRIDGWMTALQLAVLSLQKYPPAQRSAWITRFNGRNRYLVDFWAEDVFAQLPYNLQLFLLRTAVCDRFCAPLADALMADVQEPITQQPAELLIAEIEQRNLFIIPLDDERIWYKYHPLFADFLRQKVKQRHPDWFSELRPVLSHWETATNKPVEQDRREAIAQLTAREQEMLRLIAAGFSNKEIGNQLVVSLNTVRFHTKNLYRKLGVSSRTQAIAQAQQMRLI